MICNLAGVVVVSIVTELQAWKVDSKLIYGSICNSRLVGWIITVENRTIHNGL